MASFTIRVELRGNPTYEQYERLHLLMANFGFYKTINGVNPSGTATTFNLPTGTYYGAYTGTPSDVRSLITTPIKTQIQASILVFIAETVNWALGG
jgi:hypothetical protein